MHRHAAPASTLLGVCVVLALLMGVVRAHPAPAEPACLVAAQAAPAALTAWLPEAVAPGEVLYFEVAPGTHRSPTEAYLPGLTFEPIPLSMDAQTGLLNGALQLPQSAPSRGWFTLRLVDGETQWDLRIPLRAPKQAGSS
jgi:hypothetical protein